MNLQAALFGAFLGFGGMTACAGSQDRGATALADSLVADTLLTGLTGDSLDRPFQVRGGFFRGDTAFIALHGQKEIRVHDETGKLVRTIGRAGRGPGEFSSITWMQKGERSFYVYDRSGRSIVEFRFDGTVINATPITPQPGMSFAHAVGVFGDGSVLAKSAVQQSPRMPRQWREIAQLLRYARDGRFVQQIGIQNETEMYEEPRPQGGGLYAAVPLGMQSDLVVVDSSIGLFESDSALDWISLEGKPVSATSLPRRPRRPVTKEETEILRERFVRDAPKMSAVFARLAIPERWPQYGWFGEHPIRLARLTSSGRVWIVRAAGVSDSQPTWDVLSIRGGASYAVASQSPVEILDQSNDRLLVVARDRDGAEVVQIRRLRGLKSR